MIRKANHGDLEAIMAVENACFAFPWSRNDFEYEFKENPYSRIWVLVEDDQLIGYYDMWVIFEQCELANIAVLPAYQQHGYGRQLMAHMEQQALNNGCEVIALEVRESNSRAINLYNDCGFTIINTRPGYYKTAEGFEDAYRMMKGI